MSNCPKYVIHACDKIQFSHLANVYVDKITFCEKVIINNFYVIIFKVQDTWAAIVQPRKLLHHIIGILIGRKKT